MRVERRYHRGCYPSPQNRDECPLGVEGLLLEHGFLEWRAAGIRHLHKERWHVQVVCKWDPPKQRGESCAILPVIAWLGVDQLQSGLGCGRGAEDQLIFHLELDEIESCTKPLVVDFIDEIPAISWVAFKRWVSKRCTACLKVDFQSRGGNITHMNCR